MTLQNGLIHRGRGFLWTDTALFDPDNGKIVGEYPKAMTGEHWPWMVVLSGDLDKSDPLSVQHALTRDDPRTTEELLRAGRAALQEHAIKGLMGRLLFCVPDPAYGAMLYFIASDATGVAPPFTPRPLTQFTSSGNGTPLFNKLDRQGFTPKRMRRFVDWQASHAGETVHGNTFHSIGGDIIEIELSGGKTTPRLVRTLDPLPCAA